MTQNRRIVLNIAATYGRSLYAMACGIFTSRWVLMSLGEIDYGLYGVIGGLAVFITFINSVLGWSISRFYGIALGRLQRVDVTEEDKSDCLRWFNIALLIHTVVPCAFVALGYPLGVWAIRNWMVIPVDRVGDCVSLFRFVCLSAFVAMINVPYSAMYTAKQYIAELTMYSIVTTTINVIVVCYMAFHPGSWMLAYGGFMCFANIIPQIIICFRARSVFPECKIVPKYMFDWKRIRELFVYASSGFLEIVGSVVQGQGVALLVNKNFGPTLNAAMTIGNTVKSHSCNLASALQGAFAPAIMTIYGKGDLNIAREMALKACKFSLLLALIFFLPLLVELDFILSLWLKSPPEHASELCACMIVAWIVSASTSGIGILITANGRVATMRMAAFVGGIVSVIVAAILFPNGFNVFMFAAVFVIGPIISGLTHLWLMQKLEKISLISWVSKVILPVLLSSVIAFVIGLFVSLKFPESIYRSFTNIAITGIVFVGVSWRLSLDNRERELVMSRICQRIKFRFCDRH